MFSAAATAGESLSLAGGQERILNCEPSTVDPSELAGLAPVTGPVAPGSPSASDWREPAWWPVGDQGNTGACVGWALADGLIRWHLVRKGVLNRDPNDRLSVRYLWMAAKELDEFTEYPSTFLEKEGTSLWGALKVAMKFGCLREQDLPMDGRLLLATGPQFRSVASRLRVSRVTQLERDVDVWAHWLHKHGPVAVRISIDASFQNATGNAALKVYRSYPDPWHYGHAVTVVGYLPPRKHFIIRNSWGTQWGDGGYAYATHEYALAAFDEVWGIYV